MPPKPVPPTGDKNKGRPVAGGAVKKAGGKKPTAKEAAAAAAAEAAAAEEEERQRLAEAMAVMPYIAKLETEREKDNPLLKKAVHRSHLHEKPVPRDKMPKGYKAPAGGKEAALVIQCCCRQKLARMQMLRRRVLVWAVEKKKQGTIDGSAIALAPPPAADDVNPILRQMSVRAKVVPLKGDEAAQTAALNLQAQLRSHLARTHLGAMLDAADELQRRVRVLQYQEPYRMSYTKQAVAVYMRRYWVRRELGELRVAAIALQAMARRRTLGEVQRQRRLWVRDMFQAGFRAHKMTMIREIKLRKEASVPLQAAFRRALLRGEYTAMVIATRAEEDRIARREAAGLVLTSRARMTLRHGALHALAGSLNTLRRHVRAGARREAYTERLEAAYELRRHAKAAAECIVRGHRGLLVPLTRYTQARRAANRSAARLQAWMRVWLMNHLGLASRVEPMWTEGFGDEEGDELAPAGGEGGGGRPFVGRIHLCMKQKRDAAIELQRTLRREVAFTPARAVKLHGRAGYSAVLEGAAKLQAALRGRRIRDIRETLTREYGAVLLQAQCRMRAEHAAHRELVAAYVRAASAAKRALSHRWYAASIGAQKVLQAVAKMRAAPDPGLYYCRLPTRMLSCILQAHARRLLLSREHAERRMAALTVEAIVKGKVYRMLYMSCKVWCQKAGGTGHDLHKLFGKLTVNMDKNGTPFWRKTDFVRRREGRSAIYGGGTQATTSTAGGTATAGTGAGLAGLAMTEKKRSLLNEARREKVLQEQQRSQERAQDAGLVLTGLTIPIGSQRVLVEGRLAKVLSESTVVLDAVGTSTVAGCYRHFFLKNGKQSRRIEKYTRDRVCVVDPPFDRRPVEDSRYAIIDLEEAPFEPNLVLIRRQKEFEAARCIQNRWRGRKAAEEFFKRLMRHRERLAAIAAEEDYQRQLAAERERMRRLLEEEAEARRLAIEEGKRLVAEEQAAHEARLAAQKEAKRRQLERLWGLQPTMPVLPARPLTDRSPSPRVALGLRTPHASPPKPRPPPPTVEQLEGEARAALGASIDSMPTDVGEVESFLSAPGGLLPQIGSNATVGVVLRETRRRGRSPAPRGGGGGAEGGGHPLLPYLNDASARPPSSGSDRDPAGRHAFAASPVHVRRKARSGVESALIDRSPPKMDAATQRRLDDLGAQWSLGAIDSVEYREACREVKAGWRETIRSPGSSPHRSLHWDDSTRISESDRQAWDVSMVDIGWGGVGSRQPTPG